MTGPVDDSGPCGCARCRAPERAIANRPGQPALSYRYGTHGDLVRDMLAALPRAEVADAAGTAIRPLADLTTREPDDPAIALIDAWAVLADVLTFYTERIADEGFLRTATERRSILELARTIGYELGPGVAAGAYLSFTAEDAPGAPATAQVPTGTRVQSVPGQGELPHTFETVEDIEARAEWNAMPVRATRPQGIVFGQTQLYLDGVATLLRAGDVILLVGEERLDDTGSERWDIRIVEAVEEDLTAGRTLIRWKTGLGSVWPPVLPAAAAPRVYVFRARAALFGHNAPDWRAMPEVIKKAYLPSYDPNDPSTDPGEWPGFSVLPETPTSAGPLVYLDAFYPRLLPDGFVALQSARYTELYRVRDADPSSRTDFTITARTTRLRLDTAENLTVGNFGLRDTMVLAETEELAMAEEPAAGALPDTEFLVRGHPAPLAPGRPVIVTGRELDAAAGADPVSEVAFVEEMAVDGEDTRLRLTLPLRTVFDITTVTVAANVAAATEGETVAEPLGSGRGELAGQEFTLRRPPLTYVSADTPSGAASTLVVRVDGVAWQQHPSLFGLDAQSRAFIVRHEDDGTTRVIFGDGRQSGARLPTGAENVQATYRGGIGAAGNVAAGSLSIPLTRPLGIRSVTNPVPASGGDDPERLDDARRNAPNTVLTLDRIVSLSDYSDFARAFAGVAKALATTLWDGERQLIHITVAGVAGAVVEETSALFINLSAGIARARDPVAEVLVGSFEPRAFAVGARVLAAPDRVREEVFAAVRTALTEAFSFDRRDFGQPVTSAEVITVIQGVPGVTAADLDRLFPLDEPAAPAQELIPAQLARWDARQQAVLPAQLLLIQPDQISLEDFT